MRGMDYDISIPTFINKHSMVIKHYVALSIGKLMLFAKALVLWAKIPVITLDNIKITVAHTAS